MKGSSSESENVKVVVRCRPMNNDEIAADHKNIIEVDELEGTVSVRNPKTSEHDPPKMFTFDIVFNTVCKQMDVYNDVARPIITNILDGYNGTIFAYGQTGTGKTYTMEGNREIPELKGIIPNSFAHIFGCIAKCEGDKRFLVRASYLEIYNEDVRDLLKSDPSIRLEVKERPDVGVFVKDLSSFVVHSADDLDKLMTLGNKHRSVGATKMNIHSSRSHAIFTITVECQEDGMDGRDHVTVGKLHLVDLAGSERQTKTESSGQRLLEATNINLSLSALGNVISALVDGKSTHIPYRNSKLTRLLQDSLGGNAKTVMFANIGPSDYNYDETVSTLRYANRAKNIKNKARINEDPKDAMIKKFQQEIEELKKQLAEGLAQQMGDGASGSDTEEEMEEEKGKPHKKKTMSEERIKEIEAKIEEDRRLLAEQKDMELEEKQRIETQLKAREAELDNARSEHNSVLQKLEGLEKKIIVGGVNLLEKAQEQERLLEDSAKELAERKKKEEELKAVLRKKEAECLDIEETYATLQEEAAGKIKKLKKVYQLLQTAENELKDTRREHQRQMEAILENLRQWDKELQLNILIIDEFIPEEYQDKIEENVQWNEDIGEYQLKCVAYTGNNMRKQEKLAEKPKKKEANDADLSYLYLSYSTETTRIPTRSKSALPRKSQSSRSKSSRRLNVQSCNFDTAFDFDAAFDLDSKDSNCDFESLVAKQKQQDNENYGCDLNSGAMTPAIK